VVKVIPDLPAGIVGFEASDEATAQDYRETLEPLIGQAAKDGAKVRVLAVLGPDLRGYEGGAMLEDAKLGLSAWSSWERIAVVSDDHRLREAIHFLGWMLPGEVAVFPMGERAKATDWLRAS